MIAVNTEILQNDKVKLIPFDNREDFEYLYSLIPLYKHNTTSWVEAKKLIDLYGLYFWTAYLNETKVGVACVCYFPKVDRYSLDGYRDDKAAKRVNNKVSFIYEAGKLITDYMLNNITNAIWTAHTVKNRGATIACRRIGFNEEEIKGDIIVMRRRKTWA